MLVAVAGTKNSPGVTTTAFGLTRIWRARRASLLLEADPQGGSLAARLGIQQEPGFGTLAAAGRHETSAPMLASHVQGGPAGIALIVAPSAPSHARAALRAVADGLGRSASDLVDVSVVVDLGRLDSDSPCLPLAEAADQIVFLTHPTLEGADALAVRLADLADLRSKVRLVTVGEGTYTGHEVAQVLSVPHVGHLPNDRGGAGALWSGVDTANLPRRPLLRALQDLANQLEGREQLEGALLPRQHSASTQLDGAFVQPHRRASAPQRA